MLSKARVLARSKGAERLFGDGRHFTPDRRARIVPVALAAAEMATPGFPLTLNTGRVRDHWHTMTRTGKSQRLSQHYAEPFVEIHPDDAERNRIGDADLVRVSTGLGAILRARHAAAAARLDFRSHALERPVRFGCAHRLPGPKRHRCDLRTAGVQE